MAVPRCQVSRYGLPVEGCSSYNPIRTGSASSGATTRALSVGRTFGRGSLVTRSFAIGVAVLSSNGETALLHPRPAVGACACWTGFGAFGAAGYGDDWRRADARHCVCAIGDERSGDDNERNAVLSRKGSASGLQPRLPLYDAVRRVGFLWCAGRRAYRFFCSFRPRIRPQ